ncbi:MAG: tRNA pseudouridine(38-40) synthase TruA [Verrucomicrobiota bacterium]|nr:tRNA pseudouridine(38-40) synthase TruA [Verrucomicrobiota bacterium]
MRLRFIVAYDGSQFAGWQSQANGNAIQDHLERAFASICGTEVRVHGAGRTDSGVHALAQSAHVDLPSRRFTAERWVSAANAGLPPAIRVLNCRYVPDSFHARFSARGKVYRYRIWNDRVLPPFESGRAWHVASPLDYDAMTAAARLFAGEHDFAGFAANRGSAVETTVRIISSVRISLAGRAITMQFDGNGFLYKMVRLIVGAIVQAGLGKSSVAEILARLRPGGGRSKGGRFVAPAGGLILVRVRY